MAALLGIATVLVPADAGLLSAWGLGVAVVERFAQRQVLAPLAECARDLAAWLAGLAAEATAAVAAEGVPESEIEVRRRIVHLRFAGQDATLPVELGPAQQGADQIGVRALGDAFLAAYQDRFGYRPAGRAIEVESLRVAASSRPTAARQTRRRLNLRPLRRAPPCRLATAAPASPTAGSRRPSSTANPSSQATISPVRPWSSSATAPPPSPPAGSSPSTPPTPSDSPERPTMPDRRPSHDPVELELFTHRFEAIAREMGEMLRATAISTNVRERLDFSCALLDPAGTLVVNAPHIPVHLGALGLCVRRLRETIDMRPGDVVVTNHPAYGGSHLPDVTVVTPVFAEPVDRPAAGDKQSAADRGRSDRGRPPLLGYAASRAHHAELGGTRPGSMPPAARTLAEEGVVIAPRRLVAAGRAQWGSMRRLLTGGSYPSRAVEENLADLNAAVAANHRGAAALRALAAAHGRETVARNMDALAGRAEALLRAALERLPDGRYAAEERLDDGTPLAVTIEVRGGLATVDFTGSGPVHPGNLNATPAVVRSAVLYVLRLLVAEPLPLNEGLLAPVTLTIPRGLLNPPFPRDPRRAPAVVGGNVETSQRLVDTLLKALGLSACSQGTMNNVLFGTDRFGYYETVVRRHRRRAGLRRRRRRPQPHDQHSGDRPGAARAPLSGAARALRSPPRLGWRRALAGRRRRGPGADLSGADVAVDRQPAPGRGALRDGRRRGRSAGPATGGARLGGGCGPGAGGRLRG